jgi:hypothetical protein
MTYIEAINMYKDFNIQCYFNHEYDMYYVYNTTT